MRAVELVEEPRTSGGPDAPDGSGAPWTADRSGAAGQGPVRAPSSVRARMRRHRTRWVAAGLVVATALGVTAVRDARADRARADVLAVAPGVLDAVRPADGSTLERWRRPVLDELVAGAGLVVTSGVSDSGRGAVAAYAAAAGTPRWDVEVAGVGPRGEVSCVLAAAADARDPGTGPGGATVACVAVPAVGKEAWGGLGRRGQVRLVVLDAATGALVRDEPADRSDLRLTALGSDLVLARTIPGGDVRVTRQDARTGKEAWTFEGDARAEDARGPQPAVTRVEHGLVVVDGGTVVVLDAYGHRVDAWPGGVGRPDVPVVRAADDGSVPDLALVARPASGADAGGGVTLRALDLAERQGDVRGASDGGGEADTAPDPVPAAEPDRWATGAGAGPVLVLDGRVVTSDATGALTARDARDGDVAWSADATTWLGRRAAATLGDVQTDGVHLLVPLLLADGTPVLAAVDPVDGHAAWTAALPADVRSVERSGRRLLGRTATEVVGLGQD